MKFAKIMFLVVLLSQNKSCACKKYSNKIKHFLHSRVLHHHKCALLILCCIINIFLFIAALKNGLSLLTWFAIKHAAIACSFEYTNAANEDYYLLKHNTPLEGLRSPFITVSQDGVPLQYQGMYVRRAPPTKQAFVLLKAGKSVTAIVQLNDIFTFPTDGLYNIVYAKPLQFISRERIELQSATDKIEEVEVRESVSIHLQDTASL